MRLARNGLLAAVFLVLGQSVAFASSDRSVFFDEVEKLSPLSARVLRDIGEDFEKKCGAEPSVAQYKRIALTTEVFAFRRAVVEMGYVDYAQWPQDTRDRYARRVENLSCALPS